MSAAFVLALLAGPSAATQDPRHGPARRAYASMLARGRWGRGRKEHYTGARRIPFQPSLTRARRRFLNQFCLATTGRPLSGRQYRYLRQALARQYVSAGNAGTRWARLAHLLAAAQAAGRS